MNETAFFSAALVFLDYNLWIQNIACYLLTLQMHIECSTWEDYSSYSLQDSSQLRMQKRDHCCIKLRSKWPQDLKGIEWDLL